MKRSRLAYSANCHCSSRSLMMLAISLAFVSRAQAQLGEN